MVSVAALASLALSVSCSGDSEPRNGPIAAGFGNHIYLIEPDGAGRRTLGIAAGSSGIEWSSDGDSIAFTLGRDREDLYLALPDGTGRRLVARNVEAPAWSPDGEQIAFMRAICAAPPTCLDVDNPYELFVVEVGDGVVRRLTSNRGYDGGPSWSPDGRSIVYESDDGLSIMRSDGTGVRVLTGGGFKSNPRWSPDGKLIVFDDFFDVYVVSSEGGRPRQLTRNPGPDFDAAWSPDGTMIVYLSNHDCAERNGCTAHEPMQLWVMNADGTGSRQVTGYGWYAPSWGPGRDEP